MDFSFNNLGELKQVNLSLGDLTIICGENNQGKTYVTYALFGFLALWENEISISISDKEFNELLLRGSVQISLDKYIKNYEKIISEGCLSYLKRLPEVFATSKERFENTEFQINITPKEIDIIDKFNLIMSSADVKLFSITKERAVNTITVTLLTEKDKIKIPKVILSKVIGDAIKDILFRKVFPTPFIASCERTGAVIFRKELNFSKNRIINEVMHSEKKLKPEEILFKKYNDYPFPVKSNVNFIRDIESISKDKSSIAEKYPEIISLFEKINGGKYSYNKKKDEISFKPDTNKMIKLTMEESSSSVRSLLDIGFYLNYVAKEKDLLMIDEPELNLHPQNQRLMAKLLARLVNKGVKVLITTHSDYIVKEFNTLIMIDSDNPVHSVIMSKEGYEKDDLLDPKKVKVYIAQKEPVLLPNHRKKTKCNTLIEAKVNKNNGIEVNSFDKTINDMNRIQEEIVWG